jgi:hypothetical protein
MFWRGTNVQNFGAVFFNDRETRDTRTDGNTKNSPSATEFCARRVTEGEWSRPD